MKICASCGAVWDDVEVCSFDGSVLPAPMFEGPRILSGRFLLEQRIASGAMGVVLRATHLQLGAQVAIKLMLPQHQGIRVGVARFHREAQILGLIKHPNAVFVIDFGVEHRGDDAIPYLVTEHLKGEALSEHLKRVGAMSLEDAERILSAVSEAVHEAHEVGVIHRDLKPSNIFLEELRDGSQVVKVLDFGIAKFIERTPDDAGDAVDESSAQARSIRQQSWQVSAESHTPEGAVDPMHRPPKSDSTRPERGRPGRSSSTSDRAATLTEAGWMIGTIPYMAPEQMTGDPVSRRTDLYSLATLAYRMLSGRLPFEGDDDDIIDAKVSHPPVKLAELGVQVSPDLDDALHACLQMEPEDRPDDIFALRTALRAACPRASGEAEMLRLQVNLKALKRLGDDVLDGRRATSDALQAYLQLRDLLFSLSRVAQLVSDHLPDADLDPQTQLLAKAALPTVQHLVRGTASQALHLELYTEGHREYLMAIWSKVSVTLLRLQRRLDALLSPKATPVSDRTNPFAKNPFLAEDDDDKDPVDDLLPRLNGADELDALDAFQTLRNEHEGSLVSLLSQHSNRVEVRLLCSGLWRFCPLLLVDELQPHYTGTRLLPLLLRHHQLDETQGFVALANSFAQPHASVDDISKNIEPLGEDDQELALQCLLWHPNPDVVDGVMGRLSPSAVWAVVTAAHTPVQLIHNIFENVKARVRNEYLKVFFLCTKDALLRAHAAEFDAAFALLHAFFHVPCFHEDDVFEELLAVDATLQSRVELERDSGAWSTTSDRVDELVHSREAFVAAGAQETLAPSSFRDVPLPIQRRMAREGHFMAYFVSHANERVARETLPHLLRLDDVTRYLRIPTIHRAVLVELSKVKRFFRREVSRLALLQNPKTPAAVARNVLPLISREQVRQLAHNKHVGAEVRQMAVRRMKQNAR